MPFQSEILTKVAKAKNKKQMRRRSLLWQNSIWERLVELVHGRPKCKQYLSLYSKQLVSVMTKIRSQGQPLPCLGGGGLAPQQQYVRVTLPHLTHCLSLFWSSELLLRVSYASDLLSTQTPAWCSGWAEVPVDSRQGAPARSAAGTPRVRRRLHGCPSP